jgi:hypothetical protein
MQQYLIVCGVSGGFFCEILISPGDYSAKTDSFLRGIITKDGASAGICSIYGEWGKRGIISFGARRGGLSAEGLGDSDIIPL